MTLAVPVGYGIALCLSHYAPKRPATVLAFIVDLLAAVPSIIFGLWGLQWLMPRTVDLWKWLDVHLGWIPLFDNTLGVYTRSIAIASLVLAIMILPTVSAISREVFSQAPTGHIEAALALGATRWEMVRLAVIPFAKPGMISAAMLGLGRALGETIAVALLLSATFHDQLAHHRAGREHLRRQHRAEVQRGGRGRPRRADRRGPRAVRHHPGGQHDRPARRRAPPRLLGGELTWRP